MQQKIKSLGISPVLFVGSGISRRYIESPDWIGLLQEIVYDRDINFTKLKQKHTDGSKNIDLENLATDLENIYFDTLKDDEIEEDGNKPYYFRKKICKVMEKYLDDNKDLLETNTEIQELKKLRPSAIITTNYDELLEYVFGEDYTVHVGQTSLLTSVLDGVGEIYKIHGSVSSPESIVITKADYDNYYEKNMYLNAKLLTLFLEYPIIFLGYSISDRNVINILSTIVKMLPREKVNELRSRMWFISKADDDKDIQESVRVNLEDGLYIDIEGFKLAHYDKLYMALNSLNNNRLPIKFLKFLKNNVYELVASQEYNPKLLDVNVKELESIDDFSKINQFVGLSFSTKKKIVLGDIKSFCKSFLSNETVYYDPKDVLDYKSSHSNLVPFYKFITGISFEESVEYVKGILNEDAKFYKILLDDRTNYKIDIGTFKDIKYNEKIISEEKIEKVISDYVVETELFEYQRNSVRKYLLLYILQNNLSTLASSDSICSKYRKEILYVITNVSEDFIRQNKSEIAKLIRKLNDERYDTDFRKVLCYIDRAIYRPLNQ